VGNLATDARASSLQAAILSSGSDVANAAVHVELPLHHPAIYQAILSVSTLGTPVSNFPCCNSLLASSANFS
jgi:hypothetical protein